jgi:hypothetical protein
MEGKGTLPPKLKSWISHSQQAIGNHNALQELYQVMYIGPECPIGFALINALFAQGRGLLACISSSITTVNPV